MKRLLPTVLILAAVIPPHSAAAAGGQDKAPRIGARVTIAPSPARPGQPARITVQLEPPAGIKLNRYPGITLRVDRVEGLDAKSGEVFVGTRKPITDVAKFGFEKIPPLVLEVVPKSGARTGTVRGEIKYFYCVKKSGFCAPGRQPLEIVVPIRD